MALKLLVVGPTKEKFFKQSEQEYLKRLNKYCKLSYVQIPAAKNTVVRQESLDIEEAHILKHVGVSDYLILLDEQGSEYTSRAFADMLNNKMVTQPNLCFVIGGAFGFSERVRNRADGQVSLSKLTFPHHMVRTVFLEQLYRAFTILNGGRYHND